MSGFSIDVSEFTWICGPEDDPEDLCLHGHVTVQICNARMEYDGTVSATALYLLKTLTEDKVMSEHDIQMVPCCGHFLIANKDLSQVTISGCDNGLDWSVVHENGGVRLILPSGESEWVSLRDYQAEVLRFADKVESYYQSCKLKKIPDDEFSKNGYIAFWNEWKWRYTEVVHGKADMKDIFEERQDLVEVLTESIQGLKPAPFTPENTAEHWSLEFDRTEKGNSKWIAYMSDALKTARTFEIHCWNEEAECIDLALQYGKQKDTDWRYGKIIAGKVTPDFTAFLLGLPKPTDTEVYNKMTPFFTIALDNGFWSAHYGTELSKE